MNVFCAIHRRIIHFHCYNFTRYMELIDFCFELYSQNRNKGDECHSNNELQTRCFGNGLIKTCPCELDVNNDYGILPGKKMYNKFVQVSLHFCRQIHLVTIKKWEILDFAIFRINRAIYIFFKLTRGNINLRIWIVSAVENTCFLIFFKIPESWEKLICYLKSHITAQEWICFIFKL